MITKDIWINLPVKDINKARTFYKAAGFDLHPSHADNPNMIALVVGEKKVMVMLFPESTFASFTRHGLVNTSRCSEVLFSIDAGSKKQVDEFAEKIRSAGGEVFAGPEEIQGGMYGFGFADPDGHRWNMVYMDWEKLKG